MRKLIFESLSLVSPKSKLAKVVKFDPKVTVLTGQNSCGKSTILKSLYYAFGVAPDVETANWGDTTQVVIVAFRLGNRQYRLLRSDRLFAIYDDKDSLQGVYDGVGKATGIGPVIAEMMDFKIELEDKNGNTRLLPPSYYFLPFVIDQDKSWSELWGQFYGLGQFNGYRQHLGNYHLGIRPNEYFELLKQLEAVKREEEQVNSEREVVIHAVKKFKKKNSQVQFDVNSKNFQEEVARLLKACEKLKKKEEQFRLDVTKLENKRFALEKQIEIAQRAFKELGKDAQFASGEEAGDEIPCPTCGTEFENSIVERFSLRDDRDACQTLALTLSSELKNLESRIAVCNEGFSKVRDESREINAILSEKRGAVRLKDVVDSESQKEIHRVFREELAKYEESLGRILVRLEKIKKAQAELSDPKRIAKIKDAFRKSTRKHLGALGVQTVPEKFLGRFAKTFKTAGNELPRAMLAQSYAMLDTMAEYSPNFTACPLVVDSPLQQDPDMKNIGKILKFVIEKRPSDCQLILGTVGMHGVSNPGKLIKLTNEKIRLLNREDYDSIGEEAVGMLNEALAEL